MPEPATLALFLVAALMLVIVPGPNVLYTVARSMHQGRQAGLLSVFGAGLGNLVHVLAAALGLSALLASSALAFSVVKYAGAAYLLYLGVRTLLSRHEPQLQKTLLPIKRHHILYQGFLVSVLNPKTALFFLALLPQFVRQEVGGVAGQILLLGALFVVLALCIDSLYALLAGSVGQFLKRSSPFAKAQRYVTGSIYIALGISAAFADTNRK